MAGARPCSLGTAQQPTILVANSLAPCAGQPSSECRQAARALGAGRGSAAHAEENVLGLGAAPPIRRPRPGEPPAAKSSSLLWMMASQ